MVDRPPLVAVLAAGLGTRFAKETGTGKLDADLAGKPLGQWALDAVADAELAPGVLVTGPQPPAFALASGWHLLTNPHPEAGLGGSVALAAAAAMAERRDLLLLLADMPLVTPDFITRLAVQAGAAATRQADGSAGVPALLPLALLPKAAALEGARGAAQMLREIAGLVLVGPAPEMLHDVDRPQDLAAAATLLARRAT
jgi:molybdenum cofactor cytidylyltransferase